jgi:hypothetical protein
LAAQATGEPHWDDVTRRLEEMPHFLANGNVAAKRRHRDML